MPSLYGKPAEPVRETELVRRLMRSKELALVHAGRRMFAVRPTWLPGSGMVRVFVPGMRVWLGPGERWRVRPDWLTWVFVVVAVGNLFIELTQDRVTMPRDYPPVFVYGYAGWYLGLLIREVVLTRRAVRRALAEPATEGAGGG